MTVYMGSKTPGTTNKNSPIEAGKQQTANKKKTCGKKKKKNRISINAKV